MYIHRRDQQHRYYRLGRTGRVFCDADYPAGPPASSSVARCRPTPAPCA